MARRQAREHDNATPLLDRWEAGDLIAEAVLHGCENGERVYVVTTDRGLLQRWQSASEARVAHGKLRFLGSRKFASLLLHAANDEKVADAASEETAAADSSSSAIAHGYERCDKSVRAFAATQRKKRWHESKRRRVRAPDGFVAPFAERTWHRVVLAEKMRRLLVTHTSSDEDASLIKLPPSSSPLPGAETLLDDCRLDGKQRQLILKFGGALSNGLCRPPAPKPVNEEAEERSGYRFPATRRQRRKNRRDAAKRIAPAAANARTHAELSSVEREAQLDGLEKFAEVREFVGGGRRGERVMSQKVLKSNDQLKSSEPSPPSSPPQPPYLLHASSPVRRASCGRHSCYCSPSATDAPHSPSASCDV